MIAFDFFCGAGGLTRGLLNIGIDVRLGIDMNNNCRETYEKNNYPARFLQADIRTLSHQDLSYWTDGVHPENLLLAACAPCQPFTKLKSQKVRPRHRDATLLNSFSFFVRELQPRCVFIENVPGITKVDGFSSYRRFLKMLRENGYDYCEGILDSKEYGVPQTRRRLIIIASKGVHPTLPPPSHGHNLLPYRTVEDAIRCYPPIEAGETHLEIPNHRASTLSLINLERIKNTPKNGGDRASWPSNLWLECHKNGHTGHTDVYGRMRWEQPAPAITCRCDSLSNGRYGHPEQNRAISLREAARLQSFEDNYVFYGTSKKELAAQIGNAVPVKLAEAIGRHILALTS